MKKISVFLLSAIFVLVLTGCSSPSAGGGNEGSTGTGTTENDTAGTGTGGTGTSGSGVTYIGTKAPSDAKRVGDIVFTDGSAMPYSDFESLTYEEKESKKNSAIALIFYKGTGLNSDVNGSPDNTISRTLGVGLKHRKGLSWADGLAKGGEVNITTILCPHRGSTGALTFTGDKNGSDNLEQIAAFLIAHNMTNDTGVEGSKMSASKTATNYSAFNFGKNYKNFVGSRVANTDYETGWYLPSIAELFQIYACIADSAHGFNINEASHALGGDMFEDAWYWSSSQYTPSQYCAYVLHFGNEEKLFTNKGNAVIYYSCCIREFN